MEDGFARKKGRLKHTSSVSRHFVTRMDAGGPGNTTLKVETNFYSPPRRSLPVVGRIRLPVEWDGMTRKMEMFGVCILRRARSRGTRGRK